MDRDRGKRASGHFNDGTWPSRISTTELGSGVPALLRDTHKLGTSRNKLRLASRLWGKPQAHAGVVRPCPERDDIQGGPCSVLAAAPPEASGAWHSCLVPHYSIQLGSRGLHRRWPTPGMRRAPPSLDLEPRSSTGPGTRGSKGGPHQHVAASEWGDGDEAVTPKHRDRAEPNRYGSGIRGRVGLDNTSAASTHRLQNRLESDRGDSISSVLAVNEEARDAPIGRSFAGDDGSAVLESGIDPGKFGGAAELTPTYGTPSLVHQNAVAPVPAHQSPVVLSVLRPPLRVRKMADRPDAVVVHAPARVLNSSVLREQRIEVLPGRGGQFIRRVAGRVGASHVPLNPPCLLDHPDENRRSVAGQPRKARVAQRRLSRAAMLPIRSEFGVRLAFS